MSILIKGMDKPTDCGVCPFEDFGYCNVKGERNTSEVGVDADCPLIEVADRKTEPTISKMEQVETMSCQECKHWDMGYHCDVDWDCKYEPKDEPQTERIVSDGVDTSK